LAKKSSGLSTSYGRIARKGPGKLVGRAESFGSEAKKVGHSDKPAHDRGPDMGRLMGAPQKR